MDFSPTLGGDVWAKARGNGRGFPKLKLEAIECILFNENKCINRAGINRNGGNSLEECQPSIGLGFSPVIEDGKKRFGL
ncbi:MAG: hypothetical protein ABIV51_02800 [Saprospiraceae bacterium]